MALVEKEITVKLKWDYDEAKIYFVNKGIPLVESFVINDIYLTRDNVNISKTKSLDVISSCIIVRECIGNHHTKDLIYKEKKYDEFNNVVENIKYSCPLVDIEKTVELLSKIGFKEVFRYEQECLAYEKDNVHVLLQYIGELGLFAEIENNNKSEKELINDLNSLNLPYEEGNYYVKKAELMLEKIKRGCKHGRK